MNELRYYFQYVAGLVMGYMTAHRRAGLGTDDMLDVLNRESTRVFYTLSPHTATATTHSLYPWLREELRSKFDGM